MMMDGGARYDTEVGDAASRWSAAEAEGSHPLCNWRRDEAEGGVGDEPLLLLLLLCCECELAGGESDAADGEDEDEDDSEGEKGRGCAALARLAGIGGGAAVWGAGM